MGIQVGSSVVLSNGASIVIEEINNSYFYGIDYENEEYTVTLDQIARVLRSHRLATKASMGSLVKSGVVTETMFRLMSSSNDPTLPRRYHGR